MSYVLPSGIDSLIIIGATIALINDIPAMLLSVSRLIFTWAKDGIASKNLTYIHPKKNTPVTALIFSGMVSTIGVLGSNLAEDFFLGIDIMVTSMLGLI